MLYIKKKIKICIVPGYEEERLIGYRFELVGEIITRSVIPFECLEVESRGCAFLESAQGSAELRCHLLVCRGWAQEPPTPRSKRDFVKRR